MSQIIDENKMNNLYKSVKQENQIMEAVDPKTVIYVNLEHSDDLTASQNPNLIYKSQSNFDAAFPQTDRSNDLFTPGLDEKQVTYGKEFTDYMDEVADEGAANQATKLYTSNNPNNESLTSFNAHKKEGPDHSVQLMSS